jgi:hypothetical protein
MLPSFNLDTLAGIGLGKRSNSMQKISTFGLPGIWERENDGISNGREMDGGGDDGGLMMR